MKKKTNPNADTECLCFECVWQYNKLNAVTNKFEWLHTGLPRMYTPVCNFHCYVLWLCITCFTLHFYIYLLLSLRYFKVHQHSSHSRPFNSWMISKIFMFFFSFVNLIFNDVFVVVVIVVVIVIIIFIIIMIMIMKGLLTELAPK